jgi:uncharacterized membrane protein
MILTKEHYDLMEAFEKTQGKARPSREAKELWQKGIIYQNGQINALFLAYRQGYAYGKAATR